MQTELQVAINRQAKPTDLAPESAGTTVHIRPRHLLVLVNPKADTHFTVPRRVEGSVNLGTAVEVGSPRPRLYYCISQWLS